MNWLYNYTNMKLWPYLLGMALGQECEPITVDFCISVQGSSNYSVFKNNPGRSQVTFFSFFDYITSLSVRLQICSPRLVPPFQHSARLAVTRIWCHLYVCTICPFVLMIMGKRFIHVAKFVKVSRATVAVYRRALTGPANLIVLNCPKLMKESVFDDFFVIYWIKFRLVVLVELSVLFKYPSSRPKIAWFTR